MGNRCELRKINGYFFGIPEFEEHREELLRVADAVAGNEDFPAVLDGG